MEKCKHCGAAFPEVKDADGKAIEFKNCHQCGKSLADEPAAPEKPAEVKTEPKGELVAMTHEQFAEYGEQLVKGAIDKLGLTKVDKKNFALPGMSDDEVDDVKNLDGKQKVALLAKAMLNGTHATAAKAMSVGTDSAGGYTVPADFQAEVIRGLAEPGTIRELITVQPTSFSSGTQPKLSGSVSVYWGSENTAWTASDPTFGVFSWAVNILTGLNYSSRQLFADSAINLGDLLLTLFREALIEEEKNVVTTGNGSSKPTGLQNASGLVAYAQAGGSLAADDITSIFFSLASKYRGSATWMINDDILEVISEFKDTNGRYIFPTLQTGAVKSLLGRPIFDGSKIPTDLGVGSDESLIFFGDFKRGYLLKDRESIGFEISTEAGDTFAKHQVATKIWERIDGNVTLGECIVKATAIK